jgi:hypothetical protein
MKGSHNKKSKSISSTTKKSSGVHKQSNGALVPASYHKNQQVIDRVTSKVFRITARRHR